MDLQLTGVVALVVGGGGYIGSEVARALAEEGAVVVIGGRDPGRLERAASGIGGSVSMVVMDAGDAASVGTAVDEVVERFGSIGILVNCAAPSARTLDPSGDRDPDQVLAAIDGKAMGYLRCANAVIPHMQAAGWGRIVNVSGQNALITGSVRGSVRNGAVIAVSKNLADDLAGSGITVNVVNPGTVRDDPESNPQLGRPGDSTPQQVAALVVYLASPVAAAISGESIAIGHRLRGVIAL